MSKSGNYASNSTIADEINRQLTRYEHVLRMPETRIPRQITNWKPAGKRKHGRPSKSWQEGINKTMQERNLGDDVWRAGSEDMLRYEPINLL